MTFPFGHEIAVRLPVPVERAFAYLDDFKALSSHMERPSLMMAGSSLSIATDALGGRAVGSHVRMQGRMLGMTLSLDEVVVERRPPFSKSWETVDASLLVIGLYRLGFNLSPQADGSTLRVFIDYDFPAGRMGRLIGRWLAPIYARWCIKRMADDALRYFQAHGH